MALPLLPVSLELTPKAILKNFTSAISKRSPATLPPPQTRVFLPWLFGESTATLVRSAELVRTHGFVPVPHLVARNIESYESLKILLSDLSLAGATQEMLVLGGALETPRGCFSSAASLLPCLIPSETQVVDSQDKCMSENDVEGAITQRRQQSQRTEQPPHTQPTRLYFAAHPSGHACMGSCEAAARVIIEKVDLSQELSRKHVRVVSENTNTSISINTPLCTALVTQICFNFDNLLSFSSSLSPLLPAESPTVPVFVGVLPPVSPARVLELVTKLALMPPTVTLSHMSTLAQFSSRTSFAESTITAIRASRHQSLVKPQSDVEKQPALHPVKSPKVALAGMHVYGLASVETVLDTAAALAGRLM
eukprot:m.247715 g.247715  ORF g.247715 m.247715 type:complete len:366 (+) comp52837_c0_seq1:198-1295(+)